MMMMMMMTRSRYPGHESLWMQRRLLCWAARQAQLTSQLPSGATAVSRAAEQAYAEARGAAAAAAAAAPEASMREQREARSQVAHARHYARWLPLCFARDEPVH
jgi:hypothetical protein